MLNLGSYKLFRGLVLSLLIPSIRNVKISSTSNVEVGRCLLFVQTRPVSQPTRIPYILPRHSIQKNRMYDKDTKISSHEMVSIQISNATQRDQQRQLLGDFILKYVFPMEIFSVPGFNPILNFQLRYGIVKSLESKCVPRKNK